MKSSVAGLCVALLIVSTAVSAEVRAIDQARRDAIVSLEGAQNADGSWGARRLQPSARAEMLSTAAWVLVSRAEVDPQ